MKRVLGDLSRKQMRRAAAALFNRVWRLMEWKARGPSDVDEMIHAAHASAYLWRQAGTPKNFAISEWQLSRVYAVLGRGEPSRFHASRNLALCRRHRLGGFTLAYAHEALSRAASVLGRRNEAERAAARARAAAERIREKDDREHFVRDWRTLPAVKRAARLRRRSA